MIMQNSQHSQQPEKCLQKGIYDSRSQKVSLDHHPLERTIISTLRQPLTFISPPSKPLPMPRLHLAIISQSSRNHLAIISLIPRLFLSVSPIPPSLQPSLQPSLYFLQPPPLSSLSTLFFFIRGKLIQRQRLLLDTLAGKFSYLAFIV